MVTDDEELEDEELDDELEEVVPTSAGTYSTKAHKELIQTSGVASVAVAPICIASKSVGVQAPAF